MAPTPPKAPDPGAQAKRAARREGRVEAGIDQLDRWMDDLVRGGLASLPEQPGNLWDEQARRLVDAQAPGLAGRVRGIGGLVGGSPDWPARVLDAMGRLALLTHAYRRLATLDAPLQADVRAAIGFKTTQADVLAHGDVTEDLWDVLGQRVEEGERMSVQRSWLRGGASGRWALVLQFSVGESDFAESLSAGTRFRARLAFYPSAFPQRAVVVERQGAPEPLAGPLPGFSTFAALAEELAAALARQPWLTRLAAVLTGVRPARLATGWGFGFIDAEDRWIRAYASDSLQLAALSGGHAADVVGEWDGHVMRPLAVVASGQYCALRGLEEEIP